MKRRAERLAGFGIGVLANQPALARVSLGEMHELVLAKPQHPDITARSDDDALHQPELAAEGDALGRRQRLAVLVEHRNGLATVAGQPSVILGIDGGTEGAPLHAATGKTRRDRRERTAIWRELAGVALPQGVLRLPADGEIVADPE